MSLISTKEVGDYGRPMSKHLDDATILALIRETEDQDIKPVIGKDFYDYVSQHSFDEKIVTLLNGCKNPSFCGLKTAIAYYVQAKLIKANDTQITRFGAVNKNDEYSTDNTVSAKRDIYNDYAHIADNYLNEVRLWLNEHAADYPAYKKQEKGIRANRTKYKILGK